jgi:hypothetical protein
VRNSSNIASKLALATCLPTDLFFKREPYLIVGLAHSAQQRLYYGNCLRAYMPPPKNRTDRDQQRIQIGKKPAQLSMPPYCRNWPPPTMQ